MRSLLPLLSVLYVGTKGAEASEHNMPFMEYLDQDHLVCLKWGFNDPPGSITFKLVVNTTGWVGFGFSPNGGMRGSDVVMGGLGSGGSYFADYYAKGNTMPLLDEQQSYTLLSLKESNGQTTMTFQRTIKSCDEQDFHITAKPIKLIYAYGLTDEITYHQVRRGTKEVNLLNYMPRTSFSNLNYISATVDNLTVPSHHTYYHCKVMKLPTLHTKHHIYMISENSIFSPLFASSKTDALLYIPHVWMGSKTRRPKASIRGWNKHLAGGVVTNLGEVEPLIEHPDLVHHMLLYRCPSFVTQVYDMPCYMGNEREPCFGVVAAWGVGGGVSELPENVGIPVGGDDSDTLYRLEIHYNNPNMETGRTDNSGLRLYYRPVEPGQYDVGILTTGILPMHHLKYNIPPKAAQFHTYGVCNTSLFSELSNPLPDFHVFAVLLHTHLAGTQVRVGHYRGGKQIDFLGLNENYNFELQEVVNVGNIKTIKQGDEIAVECTYNTSNRTAVTKMGLATTDEMCLAFLLYYPEIRITTCISHPNTAHPLMNTSYHKFEGNPRSDQDEIAAYEGLLKGIPQIQLVSNDDHQFSFYDNGTVRDMMKTPNVTCQKSASSMLSTSWIVNTAGVILFLFQITAM